MGGLLLTSAFAAALPKISCDLDQGKDGTYLTHEGVVDLKWKAGEAVSFELQESNPAKPEVFKTRYSGSDHSSVLSGLAEGLHRFRVRTTDAGGNPGPWSETLIVEVDYMPASRVRLLLVLGALVVLATVITIVHGHFTHRRKEGST